MRSLWLALLVAPLAAAAANRDIYLYQGADRAQRVAVEAKKEGSLVLYSTMTLEDAQPLLAAFEKKHGIKVKMWRAVTQ
jgi:iron(III) transport system substrate-binding protein